MPDKEQKQQAGKQQQAPEQKQAAEQQGGQQEQSGKQQAQGGEQEHKELLSKAQAVGATGLDWGALVQQYGPVFVNALIMILQNVKAGGGMQASAQQASFSKTHIENLDKSVEQLATGLAGVIKHRQGCRSE
jgi:hypothetical protein